MCLPHLLSWSALGVLCMNAANESKLSHIKIRLNIADVRTVSVLEQRMRTVSALSVLPTYCLRNLRTLCVLYPWSLRGLRVASAAGRSSSQMSSVLCPRRPYSQSHHFASIAMRCCPREIWTNLSIRCSIRANFGSCKQNYVLSPYSIR